MATKKTNTKKSAKNPSQKKIRKIRFVGTMTMTVPTALRILRLLGRTGGTPDGYWQ